MSRPFVGAYGPSNASEQFRPVPPPDWKAEREQECWDGLRRDDDMRRMNEADASVDSAPRP